jgi:hypothetical protein
VKRFKESLSEKSRKLDDANHEEYINIDINEIDMLHKVDVFADKYTHKRNETLKAVEGRYGRSKQEEGNDADLRGSVELDGLRSSPKAECNIKVQARPQSSICGHNGLFGRKRYFEQAGPARGLQRYGKSFEKTSKTNFLNAQNRQSMILRNDAASQSHKDVRALVDSYATSEDGHAPSRNAFLGIARSGNRTAFEPADRIRTPNTGGLARSLKAIAHSAIPRGAGETEAASTEHVTCSNVNLSRHLSAAKVG